MGASTRIPRSISLFGSYLTNTNAYFLAGTLVNALRLGILPTETTSWTGFLTAWMLIVNKYTDKKGSRTTGIKDQLRLIIKSVVKYDQTNHILDRIASSLAATLTDLETFNIKRINTKNKYRCVNGKHYRTRYTGHKTNRWWSDRCKMLQQSGQPSGHLFASRFISIYLYGGRCGTHGSRCSWTHQRTIEQRQLYPQPVTRQLWQKPVYLLSLVLHGKPCTIGTLDRVANFADIVVKGIKELRINNWLGVKVPYRGFRGKRKRHPRPLGNSLKISYTK